MPRVFRVDLGAPRDLVNVVKADVQQALDDVVGIRERVELAEERRSGQGDQILARIEILELFVDRALCLLLADPDAFTAVDAIVGVYDRMTVPDTDRFRGTAL